MVNYGWICPKCGRVYAPTQMTCLYCGGDSISKQADSTQPYTPEQGFTWATNKIADLTAITALSGSGISNLSNCIIEGSGVDTSISLDSKSIPFRPCSAYNEKSGKCFGVKEPFSADCEGQPYKCDLENHK